MSLNCWSALAPKNNAPPGTRNNEAEACTGANGTSDFDIVIPCELCNHPFSLLAIASHQAKCAASSLRWPAVDFTLMTDSNTATIMTNALTNAQAAFGIYNLERHLPLVRWLPYLNTGTVKLFEDPNAGGSSVNSEAIAFEVLSRAFDASLLKTELEIKYQWTWKITDFLVHIYRRKIGVSVTRAFVFDGVMSHQFASALLTKKLAGVIGSSRNVCPEDSWRKQILFVWARSTDDAAVLEQAYQRLDAGLKAGTVVVVAVSDAVWLYHNYATRYRAGAFVPPLPLPRPEGEQENARPLAPEHPAEVCAEDWCAEKCRTPGCCEGAVRNSKFKEFCGACNVRLQPFIMATCSTCKLNQFPCRPWYYETLGVPCRSECRRCIKVSRSARKTKLRQAAEQGI